MFGNIRFKIIMPLLVVFFAVIILVLVFGPRLEKWGFDTNLILAGNAFIFGISLLSLYMHSKAVSSSNNHVFFRFVYGAFIGKFAISIALVLLYVLVSGKAFNKYGLFFCLFLYFVYSFVELKSLAKKIKQNRHA